MADTFKFELVSPERVLLSGDAEQVVLPGSEGDFAVLVGHAPVIATLRPGVIDATVGGAKKRLFVKAGFAEVEPDRLTVLAQMALDLEQLDAKRVSAEIEAAEAELADAKDDQARMGAERVIESLKALQAA